MSSESALRRLHSHQSGLKANEAYDRLKQYGPNVLPQAETESLWHVFFRQFKSPLIYVLLAAAGAIMLMGSPKDAVVVMVVLLINAFIGSYQEGKARKALLSLRDVLEREALVLREGEERLIPERDLVPGDIVSLREGDLVPADGRVIYAQGLKANESALTGEVLPMGKEADVVLDVNTTLAERRNMLYRGTNISSGHGLCLVTATASTTEIGAIATEVASLESSLPLQVAIARLSALAIRATVVVSILLFLLGVAAKIPPLEMIKAVISLSVSIIPEGLPVVVTIVLATGVGRMAKRNALVKRLQAVEALGQADVLAVDKTGTVTLNQLSVKYWSSASRLYEVSGQGYDPQGEILIAGRRITDSPDLLLAARAAAACAGARIFLDEEKGLWRVSGDPTEAAMRVFAHKAGLDEKTIEEWSLVGEQAFDYNTQMHAVWRQDSAATFFAAAGSPEAVLAKAEFECVDGHRHVISAERRVELVSELENFSSQGLRVVGLLAANQSVSSEWPADPLFCGFLAMSDSIRPEAIKAVESARRAGVRTVMITGDHARTAVAIATQAGIWQEGDLCLEGPAIDVMAENILVEKVRGVSVFARVTPMHKMRIVRAMQAAGLTVAMSGDGVNDAPSLVAADLGVAMGKSGTETAREAADIVLLDDNFASVIAAIEEGRNIFRTLRKVILYLFSTSLAEIGTIAGAIALGYSLPLSPAQIIWLNFVTDGLLVVPLALEPGSNDHSSLKGKLGARDLLDKSSIRRLLWLSTPMVFIALGTYWYYNKQEPLLASTMVLVVLAMAQWFNAWNCRHEKHSVFSSKLRRNSYLIFVTSLVVILQVAAIYTPLLQDFLSVQALSLTDWLFALVFSSGVLWWEELRKFIVRRSMTEK